MSVQIANVQIDILGDRELGEVLLKAVAEWIGTHAESNEEHALKMVAAITAANCSALLARLACDGVEHGDYREDVYPAIRKFMADVAGAESFYPENN